MVAWPNFLRFHAQGALKINSEFIHIFDTSYNNGVNTIFSKSISHLDKRNIVIYTSTGKIRSTIGSFPSHNCNIFEQSGLLYNYRPIGIF